MRHKAVRYSQRSAKLSNFRRFKSVAVHRFTGWHGPSRLVRSGLSLASLALNFTTGRRDAACPGRSDLGHGARALLTDCALALLHPGLCITSQLQPCTLSSSEMHSLPAANESSAARTWQLTQKAACSSCLQSVRQVVFAKC